MHSSPQVTAWNQMVKPAETLTLQHPSQGAPRPLCVPYRPKHRGQDFPFAELNTLSFLWAPITVCLKPNMELNKALRIVSSNYLLACFSTWQAL